MARIKYQEAIGLEVKRGRPAKGNKPLKKEIIKLYIKEFDIVKVIKRYKDLYKDVLKN